MKKFLLSFLVGFSFISTQPLFSTDPSYKQEMLRNLEFMHSIFEAHYAPKNWKEKHSGWNLEDEIKKAKASVESKEQISIKDFHKIVKALFNSTRDYHVGVQFTSTERSFLPFSVKGAEGKYFFSYIDREKLPLNSFPFKIGDELVTFSGQETSQAIRQIMQEELGNDGRITDDGNDKTDQALAELFLTLRNNERGPIPKGPIEIQVRKQGSQKLYSWQLVWEYFPEKIHDPTFLSKSLTLSPQDSKETEKERLLKELNVLMLGGIAHSFQDKLPELSSNPHLPGTKKSFVPNLGAVVWRIPDNSPFDAYLFETKDSRNVGYVRIPHYVAGDHESNYFAAIIKEMEKESDALIIDQVNNPGGSVFYLYSLASMLSDHILSTPKHRMAITQKHILTATQILPLLENISSHEEALWAFGNTFGGYPVSYEFVQFMINYFHFLIDEWNAGRTVTEPYHIAGVDKIHPSPVVQYSKPILILTNELDFSGGDFFPAILQDNKRVTILGTQTAGAGGYVLSVDYPNRLGIESFHFTGSIAERINNNPIENLGVKPDITYKITENDLKNSYENYKEAILETIHRLIENNDSSPMEG